MDNSWNMEKCEHGKRCNRVDCWRWHSEAERRCERFNLGSCVDPECKQGLHVYARDVKKVFKVDLDAIKRAYKDVQSLEAVDLNQRAEYYRIVIYGFASGHEDLLMRLFAAMPLAHEIVLPDRTRDLVLFEELCLIIEGAAETNPRLREVVFSDGTVEAMWDP